MNPRTRTTIALVALTVLALVVGVGGVVLVRTITSRPVTPALTDIATPDPSPLGSHDLDGYYSQTVNWQPCDGSEVQARGTAAKGTYECASVNAPLDWDDLGGESITLALAVHRSGVEGAPALFFNPGGPGGAAVSTLSQHVAASFSDDLLDAFDVVALDPRGVGASTPIVCWTDEERDAYLAGESSTLADDASPEEIVADLAEQMTAFAAGCEEHSGSIAAHADTVQTAKDFDMVRALLGQDTLNYLGYSYGTHLGAVYADLFPEHVGRFVLDGALDPSLSVDEVSDLQMRGFEAAIEHWVEDCRTESGCPLTGSTEDGVAQVAAFLKSLDEAPLETSDPERPLTMSLATSAIIGLLYSTSTYSTLSYAMNLAMTTHDGSALLTVADHLSERNADGTYSSTSTDALLSINTADFPPTGTIEEWAADAERLREELPVLGEMAGYGSASVAAWPYERSSEPHRIEAAGTGPILVIGTTHDPATPYVMAEGLAEQLDGGVLLTVEGWNHTAYSRSADHCVVVSVDSYFLTGATPQEGTVCAG